MLITQQFIKPYAHTVLLCFVLLWFYHDSWWINGNYLLKLFGVASRALTQSYCKMWDEITYPFPNFSGETCEDRTCLHVLKFHRVTNFDMYVAFNWFTASMCHILQHVLTHWGRDKMNALSQTIFSNAFSWIEMLQLRLKFHWSLFPGVHLTIFQHWFR